MWRRRKIGDLETEEKTLLEATAREMEGLGETGRRHRGPNHCKMVKWAVRVLCELLLSRCSHCRSLAGWIITGGA